MDIKEFSSHDEVTWCAGCGNFGILMALKMHFLTALAITVQVFVHGHGAMDTVGQDSALKILMAMELCAPCALQTPMVHG